jgi:hypothetical protein
MKTNLTHYLSLIYLVNLPLHVLGIFAHHQKVFTVSKRVTRTNCCTYTVNTS